MLLLLLLLLLFFASDGLGDFDTVCLGIEVNFQATNDHLDIRRQLLGRGIGAKIIIIWLHVIINHSTLQESEVCCLFLFHRHARLHQVPGAVHLGPFADVC